MEKINFIIAHKIGDSTEEYAVLKIEDDRAYYYRYHEDLEHVILEWAGRLVKANNRGYTVRTYLITGAQVDLFFSRGLWEEHTEDWFRKWRFKNMNE